MIFNLKELVDFMSIGTLMAYTLVAASVMILRYRNDIKYDPKDPLLNEDCSLKMSDFYSPRYPYPTEISTKVVSYCSTLLSNFNRNEVKQLLILYFLAIACIGFSAIGVTEHKHHFNTTAWMAWSIFTAVIIICTLAIKMQPESLAPLDFKVKSSF